MCQKPVRFKDVKTTPALRLLQLSHEEINRLIEQAEVAFDHAHSILHWLKGIKLEKTVREEMPLRNGGAK